MYEWDPDKAEANLAKHGVAFEAAEGFEWDSALAIYDEDHSADEDRYRAYGFIGVRLYVMAYTHRGAAIRIIGLRNATKMEVKYYGQKS